MKVYGSIVCLRRALVIGLCVLGGSAVSAAQSSPSAAPQTVPPVIPQTEDAPADEAAAAVAVPDLTLDELLNDPEGLAPIAKPKRCIARQSDVRLLVLDDETLLVEGRGKRRWLNRLRSRCVGLRPNMIMVTVSRGGLSGLCELDSVQGVSRGVGMQSAMCALGKFEPIDPAHAEMIERAFEAQRVARRDEVRKRRSERRAKRREERRAKRESRRQAAAEKSS